MKRSSPSKLTAPALPLLALLLVPASPEAVAEGSNDADRKNLQFISQSAILKGLPAQALFPFIDTTPHRIRRAHIAVTDSTENCTGPGGSAPENVQILVGEAGGTLVPVLTAATNTGISINVAQCVFHVTVRAGVDGIPSKVTDIVVVNVGDSPLDAFNTITVSAVVVLPN